jgi:methylated-DNA-protein-cysteine methyltransferase-like protein
MHKNSTNFFDDVLDVVRLIPRGRVTTYGAIARYLGAAKSSRLVGYALNAAIQHDNVPAHRVVNRIGLLTGRFHFANPNLMQELLEAEGLTIIDNQVEHMERFLWDPNLELAC